MDIYVKTLTGKVIPLQVKAADLVSVITAHIQTTEKVPAVRQLLTFAGKPLDPEKTVEFYGIKKESVIKVEFLVPKTLSLFVKTATGSVTNVAVKSNDTVRKIMEKFAAAQGVDPDYLELEFNGKSLEAARAVDSYGIQEESVIKVNILTPPAGAKSKASGSQAKAENVDKDALFSSFSAGMSSNKVEVVFCFDTTGSMSSCIAEVRKELKNACTTLMSKIKDIRIGLVAHGDYCDDLTTYSVKMIDLTTDVKKLCSFAGEVVPTGGGDAPECAEYVLRKVQELSWSEDSSKAVVIIGDDRCHEPSYTSLFIDWKLECEQLAHMGIKVYGVKAHGTSNQDFYQDLADMTGGYYVPFAQFSLITDMFMAVCYREASDKHLEAFREEIATAGKMTDGMTTIMDALAAPEKEASVFKDESDPKGKAPAGKSQKKKVTSITRSVVPSYIFIKGHFHNYSPANRAHRKALDRALDRYFSDEEYEANDESDHSSAEEETEMDDSGVASSSPSSSSTSSSSVSVDMDSSKDAKKARVKVEDPKSKPRKCRVGKKGSKCVIS